MVVQPDPALLTAIRNNLRVNGELAALRYC